MRSAAELKVDRENTLAFIAENPSEIVLKPQRRVKTATGGFQIAFDDPRPPQTLRLIDISRTFSPAMPLQKTIDGVERMVEYMLLGMDDAQMAVYDVWTDEQGRDWEITVMYPDNGYERRALAVRHG